MQSETKKDVLQRRPKKYWWKKASSCSLKTFLITIMPRMHMKYESTHFTSSTLMQSAQIDSVLAKSKSVWHCNHSVSKYIITWPVFTLPNMIDKDDAPWKGFKKLKSKVIFVCGKVLLQCQYKMSLLRREVVDVLKLTLLRKINRTGFRADTHTCTFYSTNKSRLRKTRICELF